MKRTISRNIILLSLNACIAALCSIGMTTKIAYASSIGAGVNSLASSVNLSSESLPDAAVTAITGIISFVSLIAVIAIIVAGIYFLVGMGSESSISRAKKIIIYTIVGMVVIWAAKAIVQFIMDVM